MKNSTMLLTDPFTFQSYVRHDDNRSKETSNESIHKLELLLASLVIVVLTILLLTKTISAEAGLPILSGITGFAIGKGVNANRASSPQNPNE